MHLIRSRLWRNGLGTLIGLVLASGVLAQLRYESDAAEPLQAFWELSDPAAVPTEVQVLPPEFPLSPAVATFLARLQVEASTQPPGVHLSHPFALPFEPVPVHIQFELAGRVVMQSFVLNERDIPRPSTSVIWGDTLWEIALAVRPDRSLSPQQVMLAIQDLNPEAFLRDNINWVLADRTLRLPTAAEIQSRSVAEAMAEVARQNAAFVAFQQARVAASSVSDSADTAVQATEAETTVTRDPDGFLEVLGVPDQPELSEVPSPSSLQVLRDEMMLQREMKVALSRQMQGHQEKLVALESQLQALSEWVSLELATAAEMQARAAELQDDTLPLVPEEPVPEEPVPEERVPSVAGTANDLAAEDSPQQAPMRVAPQVIEWLQHGLWILGLTLLVWLSVVFWRWRQVSAAETESKPAPEAAPVPETASEPKPEYAPEPAPAAEPESAPESAPALEPAPADPVQVQLELAEVYSELGDVAAAREMLAQVMAEGTAEQQAAAQALLARLPNA